MEEERRAKLYRTTMILAVVVFILSQNNLKQLDLLLGDIGAQSVSYLSLIIAVCAGVLMAREQERSSSTLENLGLSNAKVWFYRVMGLLAVVVFQFAQSNGALLEGHLGRYGGRALLLLSLLAADYAVALMAREQKRLSMLAQSQVNAKTDSARNPSTGHEFRSVLLQGLLLLVAGMVLGVNSLLFDQTATALPILLLTAGVTFILWAFVRLKSRQGPFSKRDEQQ